MRAHGYEANALQRSLPDDTPSSRAGFGREFDKPIALPNTDAIYYFDSAANAFSSGSGPLATGPMQERIH